MNCKRCGELVDDEGLCVTEIACDLGTLLCTACGEDWYIEFGMRLGDLKVMNDVILVLTESKSVEEVRKQAVILHRDEHKLNVDTIKWIRRGT